MNRRLLSASMVLACSFAATLPVHAAPHTRGDAKSATAKSINVTLRNDSNAAITVKAGENEYTIAPGKTATAKVLSGDKVVAETATASSPAGTLLAVVSPWMNTTTLAIH